MNYNKKSIEDVDVSGKRVLCRCDFNVPTKDGKITSDKRIVAALPTIQYLMNHGAKVILCSHMGKPKGEWKPELSLKVVAQRLSELLGKEVLMAADVVGEDAKAKAASLKDGDVMLLENVRYIKGETKNDPELISLPSAATWCRRKWGLWAKPWPTRSVPLWPFWAAQRFPTS